MKEMSNSQQVEKAKKYTYILVPVELKERLEELANKKNLAIWKVINDAINFYESIERKPKKKKELPQLTKYAWYIYKLSKSVSLFLESPNNDNYFKLRQRLYGDLVDRIFGKTLSEIDLLDRLAQQYMKNQSTQLKIQINDTTRVLIEKLILKLVEES